MCNSMRKVLLPRREYLEKTGDREFDSFVRCHYLPVVRRVYRKRIRMVTSLLPENHIDRLLDIGYGPGLLFPELSQRCQRLHGIDIHDKFPVVKRMLEKSNIRAILTAGDLLTLHYKDTSVDAVVSSSVLEHIKDLPTALGEIARVLKEEGTAVLSFPVKNKITKILFRILGFNDDVIHPSSHEAILREIPNHFEIEALRQFPPFIPRDFALYIAVRLRKKRK